MGYYLDSSGTLFFHGYYIWILFWDIEKWIVGPLGPLGPLGQAIRIFNPI